MTTFVKDPDARLDYQQDWSDWLTPIGDTISTSEWIVEEGLTKETEAPHQESFTDTTTTVWLSGGQDDTDYQVVNRVTTAGGRIDDRTITISVRQR